jgi:hypothetical protein
MFHHQHNNYTHKNQLFMLIETNNSGRLVWFSMALAPNLL